MLPPPRVRPARAHRRLLASVLILASGLSVATLPDRPVSASEGVSGASPVRVVDTRLTSLATTIDGEQHRGRPIYDGETIKIRVGDQPVVLNTVAVSSTGVGFATVYPCSDGLPTASNLNFGPGQVIANAAIASPDANGDVCIFFEIVGAVGQPNMAHVVVDRYSTVATWGFDGFRPERLYDSRPDHGGDGIRRARSVKTIHVGPANQAVALNLTATEPAGLGIFTVYPCGGATPNTSNLNYEAHETRAVMAVVMTDSSGNVCVYTSTSTHMVVDWSGTFHSDDEHHFFKPTRVMDSRDQLGGVHGRYFILDLTKYRSETGDIVAADGRAVMLNVTVVSPFDHGFVTVYPCGDGSVPVTSALNYPADRFATPNAVLVQPDSSNRVCFFSEARAHLVVDLFGFVESKTMWKRSTAVPATPQPIMSTLWCHSIPDWYEVSTAWRAARGAGPLVYNHDMYEGAEWWARHLVTHREFRHSTKDEVAASGHARRYGEVVSMMDSVTSWAHSPPHVDVITDGRYTDGAFAHCKVEWSDRSARWISVGWFAIRRSSTASGYLS